MTNNKVVQFMNPQESVVDVLTSVLRQGAQQLLAKVIEAEVSEFLSQYESLKGESRKGSRTQRVYERQIPLNQPLLQ